MKEIKNSLKFLLYANYASTVAFGILSPLYAIFVLDVGGNAFHAGASWSMYALSAGIFMLIFGRYADNMKNKEKILIPGYLILATASFGYLLVDSLIQLYIIQFLFAIGVGLVNPTMKAVYGENEDDGKESSEWGMFEGGMFVILGISSFVGGAIVELLSFETIFVLMGTGMLVAAFFCHRAFTQMKEVR